MSKTCLDCHFFATVGLGGTSVLLDDETRSNINNGGKFQGQDLPRHCHYGVWGNAAYKQGIRNTHNEILIRERGDECFFWRYVPGMDFKAASILQEREQKNNETAKQWKYTAIGLWIAGIGLVMNFVIDVVKLVFDKK